MLIPDARFGALLADLCEEAADLVRPLWNSGLAVDRKSDDSPVTEADRRAETLILARLAASAPGITVVSEEHASEFGAPGLIGPVFLLVDPVDGTKAFVRGDPNFTVNIALVVDGVPVAGAISAPALAYPSRQSASAACARNRDVLHRHYRHVGRALARCGQARGFQYRPG